MSGGFQLENWERAERAVRIAWLLIVVAALLAGAATQ